MAKGNELKWVERVGAGNGFNSFYARSYGRRVNISGPMPSNGKWRFYHGDIDPLYKYSDHDSLDDAKAHCQSIIDQISRGVENE